MSMLGALLLTICERWREWRARRKWDAKHPTIWHL